MGGERADPDLVARLRHALELGDAADVDDHRRGGQAELQQRNQRVAAGQELRAGMLAEQSMHVVERLRAVVVEVCGKHVRRPFESRSTRARV